MTVRVAGMWEMGWKAPISEHDVWSYMLRDFAADEWIMCPVSGIDSNKVTEMATLADVVAAAPETIVIVDEKGEIPLHEFEHPDDALYVIGKTSYSPMALGTGLSVYVETPTGAQGLLWSDQVIALVLYDRMVKSWQ